MPFVAAWGLPTQHARQPDSACHSGGPQTEQLQHAAKAVRE